MDNKLTTIILTKNEEKNIKDCMQDLKWSDEIIVLDDNSTDKTVDIAQKYGARVIIHALNNDFSTQRNYGLEQATNEWILFVDADERVSLSLQYEINNLINDPMSSINGYSLSRSDILWGEKIDHGDPSGSYFVRLGKKGQGRWVGKVHERWEIKGRTKRLNNSLLHYPHQSIGEFLREINYYTDLRSKELFEKRVKSYGIYIVLYPLAKFLKSYVIQRGFLDGVHGLVIALLMALHSFLVRGKLWLLWNKK